MRRHIGPGEPQIQEMLELLRLGSLDELIDYKTEELVEKRGAYRQEVSRLNTDLVRLETKGSANNVARLEAQLDIKKKELVAHAANKPPAMEKPNDLSGCYRRVRG